MQELMKIFKSEDHFKKAIEKSRRSQSVQSSSSTSSSTTTSQDPNRTTPRRHVEGNLSWESSCRHYFKEDDEARLALKAGFLVLLPFFRERYEKGIGGDKSKGTCIHGERLMVEVEKHVRGPAHGEKTPESVWVSFLEMYLMAHLVDLGVSDGVEWKSGERYTLRNFAFLLTKGATEAQDPHIDFFPLEETEGQAKRVVQHQLNMMLTEGAPSTLVFSPRPDVELKVPWWHAQGWFNDCTESPFMLPSTGPIAEAEAFLQKVYPNDEASPLFLNPFYVKSNMREIVTTQDHSPLPFGPLYVTDSGIVHGGPATGASEELRACVFATVVNLREEDAAKRDDLYTGNTQVNHLSEMVECWQELCEHGVKSLLAKQSARGGSASEGGEGSDWQVWRSVLASSARAIWRIYMRFLEKGQGSEWSRIEEMLSGDAYSGWKEATRPATSNLRALKQRISGWVGPSQGARGGRGVEDLLSLVDDTMKKLFAARSRG